MDESLRRDDVLPDTAKAVLYGVGYLGGAVAVATATMITKELLFLWNLQHRTARTIDRLRRSV